MKPMHTQWIIELYNELTSSSGREVVVDGWKAVGVYDGEQILKSLFITLFNNRC